MDMSGLHGTVIIIFPHPPGNHRCWDVYWRGQGAE